ncbi:MAG TPA: lysophospholipid acyltransferase family protein [Bacteroidales bacterium]|nr:lysophospholipid acyltransferase family protein [Bacteroidales bacterium]
MLARLSSFVLRLFGWHTSGKLPEGVRKAVLIVAPHTSYWDFVIGRLTFWASHVKIKVLIKKEVFYFPLGPFLKLLGGIPVARGEKNNLVDQAADYFRRFPSLVVVITPEGTRKKVRQWKKGFYLIAREAGVPVALAYLDYRNKTGGIGPLLYPTGDYEKDMAFIHDFYKDKTGLHPERFQPPRTEFTKNPS